MRSRRAASVLAATALVAATGVAAADDGSLAGPSAGGFTSDNVTWISNDPKHAGTGGGRLHEGYFYVTDPRGVWIYDVSTPEKPALTGSVLLPQSGTGVALGQEDPDTNGEVLLVDGVDPSAPSAGQLLVVDVSDKTAPKLEGSVPGVTDHTWTCVLDCTFAYGRTGNVVDLRDPAQPKKLAVDWRARVGLAGYTHDFTEVAPGLLMSAGQPSGYIDARDPANPTLRTRLNSRFSTLGYHGAAWPNGGKDRILVMGTEIGGSPPVGNECRGEGVLHTYDASEVLAADAYQAEHPQEPRPAAAFKRLGEWKLPGRGTYADGRAPGNTLLYCTHWFDPHPAWDGGGLLVTGSYDWGTRFLEVTPSGSIEEIGWYQPVGGLTGASYWISDDVVYALDYRRGLDVLRFTPPTP